MPVVMPFRLRRHMQIRCIAGETCADLLMDMFPNPSFALMCATSAKAADVSRLGCFLDSGSIPGRNLAGTDDLLLDACDSA